MLRRQFLRICGYGGLAGAGLSAQAKLVPSKTDVETLGTAENLIFITLTGAASHVDTFDLKVGSWTPADFEPGTFGNLNMAGGLFPKLSQQFDKFSLLRCLSGTEAVHTRAQYIMETCHTFNPVFAREQPHIGSVMALELEKARLDSDVLPTFLSINANVQGPGMLPSSYAAFAFSAADGVGGLEHPGGEALFRKRYASLLALDRNNRLSTSPNGQPISDYHNFYDQGQRLMYDAEVGAALAAEEADLERYGSSSVGAGCAVAAKVLALGKGTRVIQVTQGGWDHHYDIYDNNPQANNIYGQTAELDSAVASLLEDLAGMPGKRGGTLLDETLVIVGGEFGRTPGALTRNNGRDHYPYTNAALVAGGGIVPNQAFGVTDPEGWSVVDKFWSEDRFISTNDLIATMYSALGIDWTKEIFDTPSGRVYDYTPKEYGTAGYYRHIREMFA